MSIVGRDGTDPEDPFDQRLGSSGDETDLDTGMLSGTDAGQPGGHLGPGDLAPDEERLLAALERDTPRSGSAPIEDSVAVVRAAEDEAPLPADGSTPDDGLTPRFAAPAFDEE